jgi:processive 1,2-diacylglycerol beta-glucosyltransferase
MTPDRSDPPRRVILASASVGAGHNQAAAAVLAALARRGVGFETEFVDSLAYADGWFRVVYAGGFTLLVTKLPRVYGWGYRRTCRLGRRMRRDPVRLWVERIATRRFRRWLAPRLPALLVCTHYLPLPVAVRMASSDPHRLRVWVVVTDYEPHRFWHADGVDRYLVACPAVAEQFARWGVDPERITVTGIPVHPKWTDPLDAGQVRRQWGLPPGRPVVLLSGGAYFTVGPVERIARGLLQRSDAHVVVLAGANKRLLARLAPPGVPAGRVTGVPFTDRVHELAHVADVIVTKPGGLIVSECMAKGAAMVLTRPVPGQESANAEMLRGETAAVVTRTTEDVIAEVVRLLDSPAEAERLGANARRLYRPGAQAVAEEIARTLGG